MSSVNLRGNVEKTLAIKEFKRDYSLMAKFFFILDPDGCKNEVLQRFGRYQKIIIKGVKWKKEKIKSKFQEGT